MTVQLGYTLADLGVKHAQETLDADLFEVRFATPLAIELREVPGPRMSAHGHSDPPAPREHMREYARVVMDVVVRIGMRGSGAGQLAEACELALEFSRNAPGVVGIQLEMDSDAQGCPLTAQSGRFLARWSVDHEARARKDALAMRLDDAAIHSARDAEVVGGDNKPSHGTYSSSGGRSAAK